MENAEFDNFIKSNTRKSLGVPDGLEWENMNIPLPPKKKDRKFFFILWFSLLLLVSSTFIYLNVKKYTTNEEAKNIAQLENEKVNSNLEFETIEKIETQEAPSNSTLETINNKNITNTRPIISSFKNIIEEDLKPVSNFKNESFILVDSTNEKALEVENLLPILASGSSNTQDRVTQISLAGIQLIYPLIEIPSEEKKELILPTYCNLPKDKANNLSLSLSFGLNTFQSNYQSGDQIGLLNSAESQAIGTTYNLGLQYQFKKGFFTSLHLSYQNLHNTFSYSEELDVVVDFAQSQKIYRTKRVFYNNYLQFLELNIGGGKSFSFGKNWGSQIAININPSYKIKAIGRTLNDNESIINIEEFASDQKFFISAGAEVRLLYYLKGNNIFTSFGFRHSLSKINLLNNSSLSLQPQTSTINFGVSRNF